MKSFKANVTPTPEDLFLLNKQFSRWGIGPFPILKTLSYFALIYATYSLFMIYLQIQLFAQGQVVYLNLFIFRVLTGLLAAGFFFGKFNPLILKIKLRFSPEKLLAPYQLIFREQNFEIHRFGSSRRYTYGEILRCIHGDTALTFQTKQGHYIVHQDQLTQGTWSEFKHAMKGHKNDFNMDPRIIRKKALRDLEGGDDL